MSSTKTMKRPVAIVAIALAALALVGCAPEAKAPTVTDAYVKAVPELMDSMAMTGVFMEIDNTSSEDLRLISATSDTEGLTDKPLEIHETIMNDAGEMQMQEAEGGVAIPANAVTELKPGGNHVMITHLLKPIAVGSSIEITLSFSNGTSVKVEAVARDMANAQEKYSPEADTESNMNMDMGE